MSVSVEMSDRIADSDTSSHPGADYPKCRRCGATPRLLRAISDVNTGRRARLFQCQCGARTWDDCSSEPSHFTVQQRT